MPAKGSGLPTELATCPTCSGSFSYPGHMKIGRQPPVYCSRTCSNTRLGARKPQVCPTCTQDFLTDKPRPGRVYCSRECWKIGIEARPNTCPWCLQSFMTRMPRQKYCSPLCQGEARKDRVLKSCLGCDTDMVIARGKLSRKQYCSFACRLTHQYRSAEEDTVIAIISDLIQETPIRQHTFSWLRTDKGRAMYLDGYFPSHNLAVEYDGPQHRVFTPWYHRSLAGFERCQYRDRLKESLIGQHGVRLLRVLSTEPRTVEHLAARLQAAISDAERA